METNILEELGLTKSEIRVYLALLDLGSSSTGKIVEKSRAASSKIYEILDKLIRKGLVSFVIRSGVKYFEAASPERLLDYVKEREDQFTQQKSELQRLIPELEFKQKLSRYRSEATIFKGIEGVKTAYEGILNTLKKGDEYYVMGASTPSDPYFSFIKHFHKRRAAQGIKVKILYSRPMQPLADAIKDIPLTQIKFAPQELLSSAFVLMYADKTLISVATKNDITVFQIENKEVASSLKSQFELLWNQETRVLRGLDAVQDLFEQMLEAGKADYIGARGYFMDLRPAYVDNWEQRAIQRGFKLRNLVDKSVKGHRITKLPFVETRYHLPKEFSELSVFWIFGNKVVIANWMEKTNPILVVIENKNIYHLYRKQFEVLWKLQEHLKI